MFLLSAKTKCGADSGACQLKDSQPDNKVNGGNFNKALIYDKVLYLKYISGDKCPQCKKCNRETVITFVCATDEEIGKPEFMSKTEDCTYFFIWRTKHACEKEVSKSYLVFYVMI